ncbi:hypothetical protein [Streptomyces sp. MMBL 11-3]|uniref:hypothetical protein n=1 Tax=Streptomyces sp. MMBL 11-3 TaxID=3382639 RepID=UPI0039B56271
MVRVFKVIVPVVVLMAMTAGCSSASDEDEEGLTAQRENYCLQLGTWQKARNAARTDTSSSTEGDETETVARDALLAVQPLRDETVSQGRTLAEATQAALNDGNTAAEQRLVRYCDDAGFETLTR